ncbi:hypothetical protein PG994_014563 [Apiospora phragmitis]|uniref:Alpha-ketoglutarate-dependent dioxygenase AlkB-like domain-containing protein n=1 Tax=Apiospora phragmitis TaxID=2905665 RepID=A0ABR1T6A2_9PEZI
MASSTVTQAPDPRVAAFANSITECLEGTEWWKSNEGGVMSDSGWVTGVRTDGQGYGDYLGDNIMVTRLADGNKPSFESRVEMARKTNILRQPVAVVDCPAVCGYTLCKTTEKPSSNNTQPTESYDADYLATHHGTRNVCPISYGLLPDSPKSLSEDDILSLYATHKDADKRIKQINWEGFTCPQCIRINQRVHWNRLECRKCGQYYPYGMADFTFAELVSPEWRDCTPEAAVPGLKFNDHPGWVVHKFQFDPENAVHLAKPKESAITCTGGTKAKFEKLWAGVQDGTIPIQRCHVSAKILGQLTRFFAYNYGEEYLAKMKTETTSFDEAPEVIREVKDVLTSLVKEITGLEPDFNEALAMGNYPNMKMGWHSDGEKGVGPIVASASYGGNATMRFSMKNRYLVGRGGQGNGWELDTILPGCIEDTKHAYQRGRDSGKYTTDKYQERFKALVNTISRPKTKKLILEMPLPGTGAIMIQGGRSLKKY